MGNISIDFGLENIWRCWVKYRAGKKNSMEILIFEEHLLKNLAKLSEDLITARFQHGVYRKFEVEDNKRRTISVASIRDRVAHRVVYEKLVELYDQTFDNDVWSCRKGKGLVAAIFRTQKLSKKYQDTFFWRADVKKFFESVSKDLLLAILKYKINDEQLLVIITEIVNSFSPGISIGNLTSQIFGNIYLNEFDRFVRNELSPLGYMRYGDDFIIFDDGDNIQLFRDMSINFLREKLKLEINSKNDFVAKTRIGLKYLGCKIYPDRIILSNRNRKRIFRKLNRQNVSSYYGLLKQFGDKEIRRRLAWEYMKYT